MKKTLLVSLILLSGILLTACGKKSEEPTENLEPTEKITENQMRQYYCRLYMTFRKWNSIWYKHRIGGKSMLKV